MDNNVKHVLEQMSDLQLHRVGIVSFNSFMSSPKLKQAPNPEYYEMMGKRPKFFLYLLQEIGLNFIFADSDLVFIQDPFDIVTGNNGLGKEQFGNQLEKATNWKIEAPGLVTKLWHFISQQKSYSLSRFTNYDKVYDSARELVNDPLLSVEPDVVYSMDPRRAHPYLNDPFEGGSHVPKICGGLFYARSTPATIKLYQKLEELIREKKENDQSGIDTIFEKLLPVQIVGKLPRCIPRSKNVTRFCPEMGIINQQVSKVLPDAEAIKVRLLDIYQFANPSIMTDFTGPSALPISLQAIGTHEYYRILHNPHISTNPAVPSKIPVTYHPNINWFFGDKKKELKKIGLWLLNNENNCKK